MCIISDRIKFDFEFNDPSLCNSWVAAAIGGSALIGAGASIFNTSKAVDAQTAAAGKATDAAMSMYNTTRTDLAPFREIGNLGASEMTRRLSELTSPVSINPNDLENSDYYKFAMTQGQKGVTNSSAARGLGSSGAALKGAAAFAKGLATDTYKTSFDMATTNQKNAYDRLLSLIQTGSGAAAGTGSAGTAAAKTAADAAIGAGNAQAAGANSIGGSIANLANTVGGYAAYKGLYGGSGGSGSGNFNFVPAPGGGTMPMAA